MEIKPEYVVLFYDHSEKVLPMKLLLQHLPIQFKLDSVENFQQLLKLLDKKQPDVIIVYVNNPLDNSYVDYLKGIRVNNGTDEIPVYVFTELPEKQTLVDLLVKQDATKLND